jgi:hypothetical protein
MQMLVTALAAKQGKLAAYPKRESIKAILYVLPTNW